MNLTGMLLALAGKIMVESVWKIGIVHCAGEATGNQPGAQRRPWGQAILNLPGCA
jgi:hypothetical protein